VGDVTENMVLQREAAEDEEDVATPFRVIGDWRSRTRGTKFLMFWMAAA
jgi:hypothetical protein